MKKLCLAVAACFAAGGAVAEPEFVTCPSVGGGTVVNTAGTIDFTFQTSDVGFTTITGPNTNLTFTGATPMGCINSGSDPICTVTFTKGAGNATADFTTIETNGGGVQAPCMGYDFDGGTMPVDLQTFEIE
ncbi:MAG: hypothetical protein DHS20C11_22670 [Lysobacteraceae bacterium]|nr:MAG: hypothetical protein DHS20C11_22670 [Xanthomonadaceae bacterium]